MQKDIEKNNFINNLFSFTTMKNFSTDIFINMYQEYIKKYPQEKIQKNDLDILQQAILNHNVLLTEILLENDYHQKECKKYLLKHINQDPENLFLLQKHILSKKEIITEEEIIQTIKNFSQTTFRKENIILFISFLNEAFRENQDKLFETLFKQIIKNNNIPAIKEILTTKDSLILNGIEKNMSDHFKIFFILKKQESQSVLDNNEFLKIKNPKMFYESIENNPEKNHLILSYKNYRYHKNYFSHEKIRHLEYIIQDKKDNDLEFSKNKILKSFNENCKSKEMRLFLIEEEFKQKDNKKIIRVRAHEQENTPEKFMQSVKIEIEDFNKKRTHAHKPSKEIKDKAEENSSAVVFIKRKKILA